MRKYETVFISDPDLQDQTRADLFDKVRNIIAKEDGILVNFDDWGNKKLSYEIKKKLRGHYVCATYGGTGDLVKELERNFRLSDDVMKFMTILLSDNVTVEQLEKEIQDAKDLLKPAETAEEGPVDETADTEETFEDDEKVDETEEETK
ncbi:MAG: 30S ribosomal protein S6 [Proteobacteria bacterium]|nr:30S ribosomal protein S6 [Pseudomonadota bacterium]MBU1582536.1 30S ribosomal protein S6 [Pseudomonadota bacterium]MBU2628988.1 30S ribosomal protein S6 [Pseudomonadota bacterium]